MDVPSGNPQVAEKILKTTKIYAKTFGARAIESDQEKKEADIIESIRAGDCYADERTV